MKKANAFIRGGAWITGSQLLAHLCGFIRNMIIARILTPNDFGIAVIFALLVTIFEMITDVSTGLYIVQSEDGDSQDVLNSAHFLSAMRGGLIFLVMVSGSQLIACVFGLADIWPAFCLLALIPFINGFCHLDPRRFERTMRFMPSALLEMISQFALLALAWPVAVYFKDYRAMLFLMIIRSIVLIVVSHHLAERPYTIRPVHAQVKNILSYGWPLMINGILLYFILHGDKLLISSAQTIFQAKYSPADVGCYSLAFMLAMMPALIIDRVVSRLFLPELSRHRDDDQVFMAMYKKIDALTFVLGAIMLIVLAYSGPTLLVFLYGEKYVQAGAYAPSLALLWLIRLVRTAPTQAALAKGATKIVMVSNIIRCLSLVSVILLLRSNADLVLVAWAGITGEVFACLANLYLNQRNNIITSVNSQLLLGIVGYSCVVMSLAYFKDTINLFVPEVLMTFGLVTAFFVAVYLLNKEFREMVRIIFRFMTNKLSAI